MAAATQAKDTARSRLRSVEARFLDCLSTSEAYYKKQVQVHRRAKTEEVEQADQPPAEPSFNVSSVRRMRKIEDDYPDSDNEEDLPARPMSQYAVASAQHPSTHSLGAVPRMRSASRNSYSSLPHGARRLSRASWSTHDFQEQLDRERDMRAASRPGSAYITPGSDSVKVPEAMQKLRFDDVSSRSASMTSRTERPAPAIRPRYPGAADAKTGSSSPASSDGSPVGSSPGTPQGHRRVYSDFRDRSHSVSPVSEENKKI